METIRLSAKNVVIFVDRQTMGIGCGNWKNVVLEFGCAGIDLPNAILNTAIGIPDITLTVEMLLLKPAASAERTSRSVLFGSVRVQRHIVFNVHRTAQHG